MTIQVSTRNGNGIETKDVPSRDEGKKLSELAQERARLRFKLEQSGHNPASVTVRIAELDELIAAFEEA